MGRTIFTMDDFSSEIEEQINIFTEFITKFLLELRTREIGPSVVYNAALQSIYIYLQTVKDGQTSMVKLAEQFSEQFLTFSKNLEKEEK